MSLPNIISSVSNMHPSINAGIEEIHNLQQRYNEIIEQVNKVKEDYTNKMRLLLKRLKKQNV